MCAHSCRLCGLRKGPFPHLYACVMRMFVHTGIYVWGTICAHGYLCVGTFVCTRVFVCGNDCAHAGACIPVCSYMWRPKVDVRHLPGKLCTFYTGSGSHLSLQFSDSVGPACSRIPSLSPECWDCKWAAMTIYHLCRS